MVAVLVSHIGVLVASVLVSDLVGNLVTSIVLVVSVLMGVSSAVLLLEGETMRAGAMVSLVAAMRMIFLMTMSGIGGVSRVSRVTRVTRVIRVTRVFLELNVSALVAAVLLVVGMVLGHIVMQLLTVHLRLESLVLVGGVVDSALVAIGIDQLVVSSHLVSIAMLAVLLHIASLVILDAVLEVVLGMRVMLVVMLVMMGSLLVVIIVRHQMHGGMTGGRLMFTMEGGCLDEGGTGQQGEGCD